MQPVIGARDGDEGEGQGQGEGEDEGDLQDFFKALHLYKRCKESTRDWFVMVVVQALYKKHRYLDLHWTILAFISYPRNVYYCKLSKKLRKLINFCFSCVV